MVRFLAFRKIARFTEAYLAQHAQYRLELFFWLLANAWPFFWLALWKHAAGGLGYAPETYGRYFFYAWWAAAFNVAWSANLLSYAIRQGELNALLLRPYPVFLDFLWEHLGANLAQLPLAATVAGVALALLPEARTPPPLVPYLALVLLYACFEYVLGWLIGSFAFWLERSEGFYELYAALRVFLGGMALPLVAVPGALRGLLLWTPLPYYAYAPGALAAGWPLDVWRGGLVLVFWTLAVGALAALLWRAGLRRHGAVGG